MTIKKLKDGTEYTKANNHKDKDLKGTYDVFIKIDGIRAMRNKKGEAVSRNGKPLYNLDHLEFTDAEIFSVDWATSTSLVRTQTPTTITQAMVYNLSDDNVDGRLYLGQQIDPTDEWLQMMMKAQLAEGHEGIVIRKVGTTTWIKVVPEKFADIRITGYQEGNGKNAGMLGSWHTTNSNVGTGMTDEMRIEFWERREEFIGVIIEVGYRETYEKTGKLRFPAFKRVRWDKDDESI